MEIIAMDIMGPLPETDKGNKYILVISDYFTKWAEAYALPDHTAVTIADKLLEEFMFRFGIARQIHTDQGSEFDSDLVHEVCRLLRIKKTRTTAYRPQSDGLVERHNRTIQGMLQATVNEARDDWDNHLPYVMFAYRSSVHATTKCTPNLLMLNREAYLPIDLLQPPPEDPKCPSHYVEWVRQVMRHSHETARKNTDTNMMRQKRNYDVGAGSPEFALGDQVLYHYPPLADTKMERKWFGPSLVVGKYDDVNYIIQNAPDSHARIVHVDKCKLYQGKEPLVSWLNPNSKKPRYRRRVQAPHRTARHQKTVPQIDLSLNVIEEEPVVVQNVVDSSGENVDPVSEDASAVVVQDVVDLSSENVHPLIEEVSADVGENVEPIPDSVDIEPNPVEPNHVKKIPTYERPSRNRRPNTKYAHPDMIVGRNYDEALGVSDRLLKKPTQ